MNRGTHVLEDSAGDLHVGINYKQLLDSVFAISRIIKTKLKFSNVIDYRQPDLSTNRTV